ncbi:hypothetical protein F5Y15DRAFT_428915 [Xylariaceae sp. FL0016]|nr:hypothetical protein F5Y15DRAFT_428915 [Xylariaceae sp. FL0016]
MHLHQAIYALFLCSVTASAEKTATEMDWREFHDDYDMSLRLGAEVQDCEAMRDEYTHKRRHFEVTDWEDFGWFIVRQAGTCALSLKRE